MADYPPVTELVPHAPPILAIEELTDWSTGRATARMTVREDSPFVRDRHVGASVTLEYMAQTVAACLGYDAYQSGDGVRVGMVIGCRRLDVTQPTIAVGTELEIAVTCVHGSDYASNFEGEVHTAAGAPVATATMTLVHGERPPE